MSLIVIQNQTVYLGSFRDSHRRSLWPKGSSLESLFSSVCRDLHPGADLVRPYWSFVCLFGTFTVLDVGVGKGFSLHSQLEFQLLAMIYLVVQLKAFCRDIRQEVPLTWRWHTTAEARKLASLHGDTAVEMLVFHGCGQSFDRGSRV